MFQPNLVKIPFRLALLFFCLSAALPSTPVRAQGGESVQELKQKVGGLLKQQKYTEALLEAYILLVRTDQGIGQDYLSYLSQSRDKLRRYVAEYILTGGGK